MITHNYTGASLRELREKYGVGEAGFYDNSWWKDEPFADEHGERGEYEIDFESKLVNLSFDEQKRQLRGGFEFPHPAVIVEAVLEHYKNTGNRLLQNWYSRTNTLDSYGGRVGVGGFGAGGLYVCRYGGGLRGASIGVSSSRKLKLESGNLETFETLSLESRLAKAEAILAHHNLKI